MFPFLRVWFVVSYNLVFYQRYSGFVGEAPRLGWPSTSGLFGHDLLAVSMVLLSSA